MICTSGEEKKKGKKIRRCAVLFFYGISLTYELTSPLDYTLNCKI